MAETTARFQITFANLGLYPGMALSYLVPRAIGPQAGALTLLEARPFSGAEAQAMGLVARIAEDGQGYAEGLQIARNICANVPAVIRDLTRTLRLRREILEPVLEDDALHQAAPTPRRNSKIGSPLICRSSTTLWAPKGRWPHESRACDCEAWRAGERPWTGRCGGGRDWGGRGRHDHSPCNRRTCSVPHRNPAKRAQRPEATPRRSALARRRTRVGLGPRRAAPRRPGANRILARPLLEARANTYPQLRTRIDDLGFHLFHVRSPRANALPIIMTHGWPGSFVEFLAVIDPLTDPTRHGGRADDAFHVVIPSLPGFGFSDKPTERGWDAARTARAWAIMMQRLGYDRWVAQGGDWGSRVVHALAQMRPPGLVAAHTNWPYVFPAEKPAYPTPAEAIAYADLQRFLDQQTGYAKEQQTRPQTIGYGLADSPTGQAAWIYEKFEAWTDNRGQPEDALSTDAMLDDITLYWLTDSAASSARFYLENVKPGPPSYSAGRIELPMAASIFPKEIYRPPRAWAEALWPNIIHWNELDRGGHFAAFEQPVLFADELRRAFRNMRSLLR